MRTSATATVAASMLVALFAIGGIACDDKTQLGPTTTPTADPNARFETIDEAAAELAKLSGQPVKPYSHYDYGKQRDERCRSVVTRSEDDPSEMVEKLRPRMPLGVVIFVGTSRWRDGDDHGEGTEIVIGPGADQFDYLRLARTRGINHGLDTEKIVRRLNRMHTDYGIEIVQAETDTVVFRFAREPWNYTKLADEIYELCPDIVTRGTGTKEGLVDYLKKSKYVQLWWQ